MLGSSRFEAASQSASTDLRCTPAPTRPVGWTWARGAISASLERAAALGEVDPAANAARSELIAGLVLGMNIVARSGLGQPHLAALVAAIHAEIATWRLAHHAGLMRGGVATE